MDVGRQGHLEWKWTLLNLNDSGSVRAANKALKPVGESVSSLTQPLVLFIKGDIGPSHRENNLGSSIISKT